MTGQAGPPVPPGFTLYRRGTRRTGRPAEVTLRSGGAVAFSPAAYARLGEPAAVVFLVDRAERVLGFRAARRGEPHAYVVRNRSVQGRRVLAYLGAAAGPARRYPLGEVDGVPCVELGAEVTGG